MRTLAVLVAVLAAARLATANPPVQVGLLTLDKVYNSELMAPMDIFHHTVFHTTPGMKVFTVGRAKGPVVTFEGLVVEVEHDLESAPPIDVLVVPSALHSMDRDLEDKRLIAWVAERGRRAKSVVSACDGAFLLAAAGLLDGRRCTTFPGDIPAFRKRFPQLTVVEGVSYVADGKMVTGAGGARSYDPALHVVEVLYGPEVAAGVARGMVLDWDRERVRHLALAPAADPRCWLPGDRIPPDVMLHDATGRAITLETLLAPHPDAKAVVLCIIAGAAADPGHHQSGIWCEDTFSELPNLRHLRLDYGPRGVLFVGVLCPPVFHETQYGYAKGAFLGRADDDPVHVENRRRFVDACRLVHERTPLPFDVIAYDPAFRLLGGPAEAAGDAPTWQGRFKWFEDTQTYGTPTIWVLGRDGTVPAPPFFMNVYESEGRKLRYTPRDVAVLLERLLAD